MTEAWNKGVAIFEEVVRRTGRGRDDLNVASAMGLQLASAFHILQFYSLREQLPDQTKAERLGTLEQMRQLALEEIAASRRLAEMAAGDSRLGFHSEAEGYKYFPEKLRWRAALLEEMLSSEFPPVQAAIERGDILFGEHTGQSASGARYTLRRVDAGRFDPSEAGIWEDVPAEEFQGAESSDWRTWWQGVEDGENLYFNVRCQSPDHPAGGPPQADSFGRGESVAILIESRRIGPSHVFQAFTRGPKVYTGRRSGPAAPWDVTIDRQGGGWSARFTIPLACLGPDQASRLRINLKRVVPAGPTLSWVPLHPARYRLLFDQDNAADYGWLVREKTGAAGSA
jgi:hypothetical protein